MSEWKEVELKSLTKIITKGTTPTTIGHSFIDNGINFIKSECISDSRTLDKTKFAHISFETHEKLKRSQIIENDILFSMAGMFLGKTGIVKKEDIPANTNQAVAILRINENYANYNYIYYFLNQKKIVSYINSLSGQSAQPNINLKEIGELQISLPPLATQQKIAKILSSLDDKIELNNKINKNLEEQAMAICEEAIYQKYNETNSVKRMLSDIATFFNGYSYKGNELAPSNIAMATIKNFDRNSGFKVEGFKQIRPSTKIKEYQYAKIFDILIAHTDLTQNAEVIGNAEVILTKEKFDDIIFSMDLVKVNSNEKFISNFLLSVLLKNKRFKSHCLGYVNGTTVLHLSKKALNDYFIYLPQNLEVLKTIDDAIKNIYIQITEKFEENQKLSQLRDTLLPKLMSGEIDVENVEI